MNAPHPSLRTKPDHAALVPLLDELMRRFGDRVATSEAVRQQHGHSLTWAPNQPPDAVVYPQTT